MGSIKVKSMVQLSYCTILFMAETYLEMRYKKFLKKFQILFDKSKNM